MSFQFEKVYDYFAKPLNGSQLEFPFGPYMFMVNHPMSAKPKGSMVPQIVVLSLMAQPKGNESIDRLAMAYLQDNGDDFCIALVHEGYVKKIEDVTPEQQIELQKKGLSKDPNAQLAAMIRIYHKTGSAAGFCPMNKERRATYMPLEPEESVIHVNVGAEQNYPH